MPSDLNTLTISLDPFATGFTQPLGIAHADDDSDRLFVVEKGGTVRIIDNGVVLDTPFIDISDRISTQSEGGLLGLAFSPSYDTNGEFYLNYTDVDGDTAIARYQVSTDPNQANPNSEQVILAIDQPLPNHNGGQIAFGPDSYLYIGMGDGGGSGDPDNLAQDPSRLLGKMLRIDVESSQSYAVPDDNPFLAIADPSDSIRDEIWASGLRNPWRFSFDRVTGDLYIADVGQGEREEVNFQPADSLGGENYGWRVFEGTLLFNDTDPQPDPVTAPVAEYDHSLGQSITGGYVYRGDTPSDLTGVYLYGDFISGQIWGLRQGEAGVETAPLLDTDYLISTFGEDESGDLYVADFSDGAIYAITPPPLSSIIVEPPIEPILGGSLELLPTVDGTNGNDRLQGERTNDTLHGRKGADILRGKRGHDQLTGGLGRDRLFGGNGRDQLLGRGGADRLNGGKGNDRLNGGTGSDQLRGKAGRDVLVGNQGRDQMWGGAGRDTFVIEMNAGPDRIQDFQIKRDRFELPIGITFGDVGFQQQANATDIFVENQLVATVLNIQAEQLGSNLFN